MTRKQKRTFLITREMTQDTEVSPFGETRQQMFNALITMSTPTNHVLNIFAKINIQQKTLICALQNTVFGFSSTPTLWSFTVYYALMLLYSQHSCSHWHVYMSLLSDMRTRLKFDHSS